MALTLNLFSFDSQFLTFLGMRNCQHPNRNCKKHETYTKRKRNDCNRFDCSWQRKIVELSRLNGNSITFQIEQNYLNINDDSLNSTIKVGGRDYFGLQLFVIIFLVLVSAKHRETKQYYTLYNTLDSSLQYMTKELSLLNSIYEGYAE